MAAAVRVELGFGVEECFVAADSAVVAATVDAGEGALGALAAGDLVLEFVQLLAPFDVGFSVSAAGFPRFFGGAVKWAMIQPFPRMCT